MAVDHSAITDNSASKRIESIDVFRALTMMVMVFVNDLDTAGNSLIQNVPPRLGHGEGYEYAHDGSDGWVNQDYLGVERSYYEPVDRGFEAELQRRMEEISKRRRK